MIVNSDDRLKVAVVAVQGDFEAHEKAIEAAGGVAYPARTADDITHADAIILPGGESTTIGRLLVRFGLDKAIYAAHDAGKPIYGTCAGMILLSKRIVQGEKNGGQPTLGLLDVGVVRNAWGRQVDSFEADVAAETVSPEGTVRGVFIRAPYIAEVGPGVDILARYDDRAVLVRQGNVLASSFHPELTGDHRVHRYFLDMVPARAGADPES